MTPDRGGGEVSSSGGKVEFSRTRWLPLAALVVFALSLRAPISSLGGVLPEAREALNLGPAMAGLTTTLPVLFFAAVGLGAARAINRTGLHRATVAVLLIMAGASGIRAASTSAAVFVGATALLLAGIAVGNVLLPVLAKHHYPDRLAFVSSLYGAAVIGGSSLGALSAAAIGAGQGWRAALAATATLPVIAVLMWAPTLRHDRGVDVSSAHLPISAVAHCRGAWALAACFGLVCAQAYAQLGWYPAILVDAGASPARAAAMLTLLAAAGIPTILALPLLVRLFGNAGAMVLFGVATALGWLGLLIWPSSLTPVWSILIGFGAGSYAWTMTMIGVHARTAAGAAGLSSFTQGVGFLLSAVGPFGVGILRQVTGTWTVALVLLLVTGLLLVVAGFVVSRPWIVEDDVGPRSRGGATTGESAGTTA